VSENSYLQAVAGAALSMLRRNPRRCAVTAAVLGVALVCAGGAVAFSGIFNLQPFLDPTGVIATYNTGGSIDTANAFFQNLGTNGRTCASCHQPSDAFGLSVAHLQARFVASGGTDPVFAPVDGANCPTAASVDAASRSLLLNHGLIRIGIDVPTGAQFTINVVHDPYGCAMVPDPATGQMVVSVYRRPLPTTNLNFLSTVMFDGRETVSPLNSAATFQANLIADLTHQAMDATNGHAQANPPLKLDDSRLPQMVSLELGFSTAQIFDNAAGYLAARGARGGPAYLSQQQYHPKINDVLGADPSGPFNPNVFTIFSPWQSVRGEDSFDEARGAIAAGEVIFNTRPLNITNVRGINDNPTVAGLLSTPLPVPSFTGTCTTCHDTPNVGDHSVALPLDIGTSHSLAYEMDPAISAGLAQLSFPDVPVYQILGCPDPFASPSTTGLPNPPSSFYTTDPGKALITGLCSDFNRGKGPILRGLAARAPYFHNGAAKNLSEIVNFYNLRFDMKLTNQEKVELIAFLNSL
jgi:cytochrome c peroxidase